MLDTNSLYYMERNQISTIDEGGCTSCGLFMMNVLIILSGAPVRICIGEQLAANSFVNLALLLR